MIRIIKKLGDDLMFIFSWLNDQLLKMEWLNYLVTQLVQNVFGLNTQDRLGGSIQFFIYDVIKIFILLSVLIFIISYIQSFFPPERTRKILGGFNGITANILGALLGTITPFCSCSSIPLFIGFTSAGLPIGVTFSFLISSPLVDLASVILLASIFNWQIAIAYVIVGLILAVIGGTIIGKAKLEDYVEPFVYSNKMIEADQETLTTGDRMIFAKDQVWEIVRKVWLYILIGVGIGAVIHNWIPESIVSAVLGQDKWYSVLIATLVGVPMYADIFGTLPIAEALVSKGAGLGTVLAFMMAVTALSLPSMIMLKKVVKTKLLVIFVGIVITGILIIGYVFNAFGYLLM
ncbi:permease [Acetobacterium woodii DSM 1030]|uniref:Permease n=2 Tax=Acetobacterium woodii TaxID=33952 RepID=H6LHS9_ACEWD|nr:permease [Acetobacterium woodii DSM 1030]